MIALMPALVPARVLIHRAMMVLMMRLAAVLVLRIGLTVRHVLEKQAEEHEQILGPGHLPKSKTRQSSDWHIHIALPSLCGNSNNLERSFVRSVTAQDVFP
jgi:hypothetical protein